MVKPYQLQDKPLHTVFKPEAIDDEAESITLLVNQAQQNRSQAKRARRLANNILTTDVVETLKKYADELEELARELDQRVATITVQGA